jgi:hypothetical protein
VGLFILCDKLPFIILWKLTMYICIGGYLDGEVVNDREGTYFELVRKIKHKSNSYNKIY